MKQIRGKIKRRGFTIYLSAALLLFSIACLLFPYLGENLPNGNPVYFTSYKLLFGGEDTFLSEGYSYSFQYNLNLPILIIVFVELIAMMAALAGRNAPRHIGICATLSLGAAISLGFTPKFTSLVNESLIYSSLILGPGYFLTIVMTSLATVVGFIELAFCVVFWKKKTAF